ncbi:MAG: PaaI family thioesterase [Thermodesulfobacteriota bacterium]
MPKRQGGMCIPVEQMREFVEQGIPYNAFLGLQVDEVREGFCRLRLPFRPEFVGDSRRPAQHGGLISFLVDTCGGVAVWSCCCLDDRIATIDLRVDYLRPAPPEELAAEAEVRLLGNRVGNATVRVFAASSPDETVAEGRGVYNVRRGTERSGG